MEKVNTGNLYMDDLVQNLKKLSLNTILKDESEADQYETVDTLRNSNIYIACIENIIEFGAFLQVPVQILIDSGVPFDIANQASLNPRSLPIEYVPEARRRMVEYFIANYKEENDYYRMLSGLPPMDDIGIFNDYSVAGVRNISMHNLEDYEIELLENAGVMDQIIDRHPEYRYLRYLGANSVDFYTSRKAVNFGLLYCPMILDTVIRDKYIEYIEKNRVHALKTIYSEAYKFNSEYYDKFIAIFIIIQTIVDIIIEVPERIIRKEFFDEVSIRDMFLSHGIDYFPEIPLKYQLAMIQNLNELLKFKSTTKNLIDICSIFGFENVEIFKYYLLKDRKIDESGNYVQPLYEQDEDGNLVEIEESIYDLKFVRVPINEMADRHLRDTTKQISYSDIVSGDEYWYGNKNKDEVDKSILDQNFNYVLSKYISIDTVYEMSKVSFDMTYFINMVFDNKELYEKLTLSIPRISMNHSLKLSDIICFMYSIMYMRIGIDDVILDSRSAILHVLGFNFKADLGSLYTYLTEKGYSFKDVGIHKFAIPNAEAMSYNELLDVYTNNKEIHDHVLEQMGTADSIHIYRLYEKIYKSLMVSELNTQNFTKSNGMFAGTYTEYLKDRNPDVYDLLVSLEAMNPHDRIPKINEYMDLCIKELEFNLNNMGFDFFATNINTSSTETIKEYLYKLVNFFKSHTVQLLSSNTVYTFSDRWVNRINIFDEVFISTDYNARTLIRHTFTNDKINFGDVKGITKYTNMSIDDKIVIRRIYE